MPSSVVNSAPPVLADLPWLGLESQRDSLRAMCLASGAVNPSAVSMNGLQPPFCQRRIAPSAIRRMGRSGSEYCSR